MFQFVLTNTATTIHSIYTYERAKKVSYQTSATDLLYGNLEYLALANSRGSSVGIATGYGLDDRGFGGSILGGDWEFFSFPLHPDRLWGPPGVKRPGRGADHSVPSSAMVKNAWLSTSTPQYVFMAWCL
jgi:hypothetical protein